MKMLQTVFPEDNADDPFASIIAKQPKIIDHNLRIEKTMTAKQKWKAARFANFEGPIGSFLGKMTISILEN